MFSVQTEKFHLQSVISIFKTVAYREIIQITNLFYYSEPDADGIIALVAFFESV